jgi:ABC-2 type transport system ATP-binding protein
LALAEQSSEEAGLAQPVLVRCEHVIERRLGSRPRRKAGAAGAARSGQRGDSRWAAAHADADLEAAIETSETAHAAITAIGVVTSLRRDDVLGGSVAHGGAMIEVTSLTKRYGETVAVDDLSFTVRPGIVTGFLGPNGAGKSTTMRMILGLDNPSQGRATVNGRPLAEHAAPLTELGALLEARAIHPQRSARNHLRALAATTGIPDRRVDEVLRIVGLDEVADRAAGAFSLGMGQRLGIASALLGDPETVMLDEPVNGLDPEGILWIRNLLKELAAEGRTVFVSSHLMSEMALAAEHFIIIGRGRLIADVSAAELAAMGPPRQVLVRTPHGDRLRHLLAADGVQVTGDSDRPDAFYVTGMETDVIGRRLMAGGVELHELTPQQESLEGIFMGLTQEAVQYRAHAAPQSTTTRQAA